VQDAIVWQAPSLDLAGGFFEIPKSPAPQVVALLGLLGMVLGEQFGIWVQAKKLDVSRAASVCLVSGRLVPEIGLRWCSLNPCLALSGPR
jgi:Protein of unknown function (DUF1427)